MPDAELYHALLTLMFVLAGVVFAVLGRVSAPYGRHARPGWGPGIPERWGWALMASPACLLFAAVFFAGPRALHPVPVVMLVLWQLHYGYRALVYPWRMRGRVGRRIPVVVVFVALGSNAAHAYLNARWLTAVGPELTLGWLLSFRFLYGLMVFGAGMVINRWADQRLRRLRTPGTDEHVIPRGGLFDEISCPNYFGELLQWIGWSILTWSPAGLACAAFTAATLVPRAVSHHRWYFRRFPDYPRGRRAIIPHLL